MGFKMEIVTLYLLDTHCKPQFPVLMEDITKKKSLKFNSSTSLDIFVVFKIKNNFKTKGLAGICLPPFNIF